MQKEIGGIMDLHRILDFAVSMHYGQNRKDGNLPYIVHPIDVMHKVASLKINRDYLLAVALCHDILEDCPCEPNDIQFMKSNLGEYYSVIEELTFKGGDKEAYLESFANKSLDSLVIKMVDRVCNVLDFKVSSPNYAVKYYGKAKCLEKVLLARKEEFCREYGDEAFNNLWNMWISVI